MAKYTIGSKLKRYNMDKMTYEIVAIAPQKDRYGQVVYMLKETVDDVDNSTNYGMAHELALSSFLLVYLAPNITAPKDEDDVVHRELIDMSHRVADLEETIQEIYMTLKSKGVEIYKKGITHSSIETIKVIDETMKCIDGLVEQLKIDKEWFYNEDEEECCEGCMGCCNVDLEDDEDDCGNDEWDDDKGNCDYDCEDCDCCDDDDVKLPLEELLVNENLIKTDNVYEKVVLNGLSYNTTDVVRELIETCYHIRSKSDNALIIFVKDCSGSMTELENNIVKCTTKWMKEMLKEVYSNVDIEYIVHNTEAQIVSHELFVSKSGGGTIVSSGMKKVEEIVSDFDYENHDVYIFYFSDGDNLPSDNCKASKYVNRILREDDRKKNFTYICINQYGRKINLFTSVDESEEFVALEVKEYSPLSMYKLIDDITLFL